MPSPGVKAMNRLGSYVRKCARILDVVDCQITVAYRDLGTDVWAQARIEDMQHAIIEFGPKFFDSTTEEQKRTVAHELMHVRLRRMSEPAREITLTAGKSGQGYWLWFYRAEEDVCEAMERPLSKLLPEPKL